MLWLCFCHKVDEKALELFTLKEEIQQMQVEISKKEEYVQMIEKIVDEKRSLLKVSEFIQTEQDEAELVILIEQMFSGKFNLPYNIITVCCFCIDIKQKVCP